MVEEASVVLVVEEVGARGWGEGEGRGVSHCRWSVNSIQTTNAQHRCLFLATCAENAATFIVLSTPSVSPCRMCHSELCLCCKVFFLFSFSGWWKKKKREKGKRKKRDLKREQEALTRCV